MRSSLLVIMLGCTAPAPPPIPTPARPSTSVYPCPTELSDTPFRWLAQPPTWAEPSSHTTTRNLGGRLRLPIELSGLPLHDLYVLGQSAEVTEIEETHDTVEVLFQGEATCEGRCDHAWITMGGPDGPAIFVVPTPRSGDLTGLLVTLETTARATLGISSGGPAAVAQPLNPGDRRDLDRFVDNVASSLLDDLLITQRSGITVHGVPLPGTETLATLDVVLSTEELAAPEHYAAPWLFPLAQTQVDTQLTLWSERGRSDPIPPSDGRFSFILGEDLNHQQTWIARFTGAHSQSAGTTYHWPPPEIGQLQVHRTEAGLEISGLIPEGWVVVRHLQSEVSPWVCEVGSEGGNSLVGDVGAVEIVHTNKAGKEILAHTTCGVLQCP